MYLKEFNCKIELYIDGYCPNNPGSGGFGYLIRYEEKTSKYNIRLPKTMEFSQAFWLTTLNRLEIMAAISGIHDIICGVQDKTFKNINQIDLYSDSKYYCDTISNGFIRNWSQNNWVIHVMGSKPKPVKNQDLWKELLTLMDECAETGILLNTNLIEKNSKCEFHDWAEHLAITALTGYYDQYVSDAYYEKNNNMNFSKCYDCVGT